MSIQKKIIVCPFVHFLLPIEAPDYLATRTSLSPIWRGFAPGFVNYKKGCTGLTAVSDKVYQLLPNYNGQKID
jgi:hypothetical protein